MFSFILIFVFGLFCHTFSEFLVGVDISHVRLFEEQGIRYRDYDGLPMDLFALLEKYGIDCVRVSLFTSNKKQVEDNPYDFSPHLEEALELASRAKKYNLKFLLDFQYSDSWASPNMQTKPIQWINMTFEQLKQQLYNYTRDTIKSFIHQNTIPDYVQIGNEVSAGMLWPDGNWSDWKKLGSLLRAASKGVRDATQQTKIIIHLTHIDTWSTTKWLLDHIVLQEKIDFDIIGESYYPFWDGPLSDVRNSLHQMVKQYQKPIIIAETAFPWTHEDPSKGSVKNTTGFDGGPDGQVSYVRYLRQILKELPNGIGMGTFWWAAEYQTNKRYPKLAGFESRSFFNITGYSLPILCAFGQLGNEKRKCPPEKKSIPWLFITGVISLFILIIIIIINRKYSNHIHRYRNTFGLRLILFWRRI